MKDISDYSAFAESGKRTVELTQEEAATVLKIYDYGLDHMSANEQHMLNSIIDKLKDEIWP